LTDDEPLDETPAPRARLALSEKHPQVFLMTTSASSAVYEIPKAGAAVFDASAGLIGNGAEQDIQTI